MKCRYCKAQAHDGALCHDCREKCVTNGKLTQTAHVSAKQMDEPTSARPGTPEKVIVLERRVKQNRVLWNPFDATDDDDEPEDDLPEGMASGRMGIRELEPRKVVR